MVAETYRTGRAGRLIRAAEALTAAGALGAALSAILPGGPTARCLVAAGAGCALLAGSACTRFGVFAAGTASAEDPKYTTVPQRARLTART